MKSSESAVPRQSERQFMAQVVELATALGWACFHQFDSRRSAPGWPDLGLIRPPRLMLAELKVEGGKLTSEQAACLSLLAACPGADVHLWRPSDWDEIEAELRREV